MKRTRIMGLCVMAAMAALAMSAIAASSASAGTFYTCSAQKKGNYTESGCKTVAEKKGKPDHKGSYEKATGLGLKSTTGEAKLETPSLGGTVKCSASTGTGVFTGDTTTTLQVTFTGCETKGVPCESGATLGTIVTLPLETILIDNPEKGLGGKGGPLAGEVWTDIKGTAANGGVQAVFGCEGVGYFKTTGTLAGVDGGVNKLSTTGTQVFSNGLGEQGLETEVSSNPSFPAGETLGPFASTEVVNGTVTYEKEVDVKS